MGPAYIDTIVFIAAFETDGMLSESAWSILDAVTRGDLQAHTSELTLAELLVRPFRLGSDLLTEVYTGLITTGGTLSVSPVSRAVLIQSARMRAAQSGLKLHDAIHMATAVETGCRCFVTDDQRLRPLPSLPMVGLGQDALARIEEILE